MYPTVKDRSTEIASKEVMNSNARGNAISYTDGYDVVFVSLNRYERKKNIQLAIDAMHHFSCSSSSGTSKSIALVIAGGYDLSVAENEGYLTELKHHCTSLKLPYTHPKQTPGTASNRDSNSEVESCRKMVVFRTSISGQEREALLTRADALLYTPDRCATSFILMLIIGLHYYLF
jgi:glycosyltransferase involved in cell wall biosynthesis